MKKFNYIEYIANNPLLKEEQDPKNLQKIVDYFIQDMNRGTELNELQKALILVKRNEILEGEYNGVLAKAEYFRIIKQLRSESPEDKAGALELFNTYIWEPEMTKNIWDNLKNTYGIKNLGEPPTNLTRTQDIPGFIEFLINRAGDALENIKDYFKKVYDYFKEKKSYLRKQAELNKDSTYPDYADSAEAVADAIGIGGQLAIYVVPIVVVIAGFLYRVLGVGKSTGKKWYPSKARKDYEDTDPDGFFKGQIFEQNEYKDEIKKFFENIFKPFAIKFVKHFKTLNSKQKISLGFSIAKAVNSNDESELNAVLPDEVMPEYNKVVNYLKGEEVDEEQINEVGTLEIGIIANFILNLFKFRFDVKNNPTKAERYISDPKIAYVDAAEAKTNKDLKKIVKNLELALKKLEGVLTQTKAVIKTDTEDIEDAVVVAGKKLGREVSLESLDKQIDKTLETTLLLANLFKTLTNELNIMDVDAEAVDEVFNVRNWQCRRCGSPFTYTLLGKRYCEPDDDFTLDCPNSYTGTPTSRQETEFISLNESVHEGELEDKQQDALSTIDKLLKQIEKLTKMYRDTEND